MDDKKLITREETDVKATWCLEDMFATDEVWEEEFSSTKEMIKTLPNYVGKVSKDKDELLDYLMLTDKIGNSVERLYVYSNQRYHQDMSVSKYQAFAGKAETLYIEFGSHTAFFEPEILGMEEAELKLWLEDDKLNNYKRFLSEILRKKEHTLDSKTEEILAKSRRMAQAADNIYTMFNGADIDFPTVENSKGEKVKITHGNFVPILTGTDRVLRKRVFKAYYETYDAMKNTLAATFNANVVQAVFYANVRKYDSTRAMYLNGSNIPEEVYDNLIDTVHQNLDLMYRYVALRKKLLGVDELHMYDVYVPIVEAPDKYIPFEEAKRIVKEGLAPMGEEYLKTLQEGFDNRWIDVYENKGKKSGAYSWGAYGTHPYVLLNYQGTLDHVFTLAHEMGHALHSYYSNKNQTYINAEYRIFVAEVASICNEALLIRHMINKTQDNKEKAYLINHFLEQFKGTLYRQTMFAEFEKITHKMVEEGETLTSEELNRIYYDLNKLYFGEDMISDEEIALEWARIPHFYTPFYVYQYATGLAAAIALSAKIIREGEKGVEDYMKFLTGGCTKDPIDLLKMAGVDMGTREPIEDALQLFKELLDEMESITEQ
ncbi:MAG: oligoendopeptidase F [Lachnospiraceae bacterium]|nr:oligoendopeptidase F [Lachnospiraceae bacterium]